MTTLAVGWCAREGDRTYLVGRQVEMTAKEAAQIPGLSEGALELFKWMAAQRLSLRMTQGPRSTGYDVDIEVLPGGYRKAVQADRFPVLLHDTEGGSKRWVASGNLGADGEWFKNPEWLSTMAHFIGSGGWDCKGWSRDEATAPQPLPPVIGQWQQADREQTRLLYTAAHLAQAAQAIQAICKEQYDGREPQSDAAALLAVRDFNQDTITHRTWLVIERVVQELRIGTPAINQQEQQAILAEVKQGVERIGPQTGRYMQDLLSEARGCYTPATPTSPDL